MDAEKFIIPEYKRQLVRAEVVDGMNITYNIPSEWQMLIVAVVDAVFTELEGVEEENKKEEELIE